MSLTNLCNFALLFGLSFSMAGLSWFLQMCYGKGMIFRKYKALITYWLWFKGRPRGSITPRFTKNIPAHVLNTPRKWWSYLYKPLGGCPYCQGPWLATFFYVLGAYLIRADFDFVLFLWAPYIGMVYVWIEVLKKYCI